jgi:membrane protein required for colicin V production
MPREAEWQHSQVVPVFVPGAQWMRAWLPEWAAEHVDLEGNGMPDHDELPPAATPDAGPALPAPVSEA